MRSFVFALKSFLLKNNRLMLSLLMFFLVFVFLGLPYTKMGFWADDFGNIFHSKINCLKDLYIFFCNDCRAFHTPLNGTQHSFFSAYYRPMVFVFYWLQRLLFGFSGYGYYLVFIFLHALNAVFLFNICFLFTTPFWAFCSALFFAFHSSFAVWLGWVGAQQHPLVLFLILWILFFYLKYLYTNKILFYLSSASLYAIALFVREVVIVTPVLLFLSAWFYQKKISKKNCHTFVYSLAKSSLFWLISFFYCLLRYLLFFNRESIPSQGLLKFLLSLKGRLYELVCLLTDILGLSWFPWGYPYLKSLIFLSFFLIVFLFFIFNVKKSLVVLCSIFTVGFFWPLIFASYDVRYLYEPLPFFILTILSCVSFSGLVIPRFLKNILGSSFCLLIGFNLIFLSINLSHRERSLFYIEKAFDDLVCETVVKNRALCFVGLPAMLSLGVEHAVWIRDGDCKRPIYYDSFSAVVTEGFSSFINNFFAAKFSGRYFDADQNFDKNYVEIFLVENRLKLRSLDCRRIWFVDKQIYFRFYEPGEVVVNQIFDGNKVCDLTLIIDKKIFNKNLIFVTWDYMNQKFLILNK